MGLHVPLRSSVWFTGALCLPSALSLYCLADLPSQSPSLAPAVTASALPFEQYPVTEEALARFCDAALTAGEKGAVLKVMTGVAEQMNAAADETVFCFGQDHNYSVIPTQNSMGHHADLHIHRLPITLDEIERGRPPVTELPAHSDPWRDEGFCTYRRLLTVLTVRRDLLTRDILMHADQALIILRSNGALNITLYRTGQDGTLLNLGLLTIDNTQTENALMDYRLQKNPEHAALFERMEAVHVELAQLQAEVMAIGKGVVEAMTNGRNDETVQNALHKMERAKARLKELYEEADPPEQLCLFTVQEKRDNSSQHGLKVSSEGGLEAASQGASFAIAGAMQAFQATQLEGRLRLNALYQAAYDRLNEVITHVAQYSSEPLDGTKTSERGIYLARMLLSIRSILRGKELPVHLPLGESGAHALFWDGKEYLPVHANTASAALDYIQKHAHDGLKGPDRYSVASDHYSQLQESLAKMGWWAWLKSFFKADSYQHDHLYGQLRDVMKLRKVSRLSDIIEPRTDVAGKPYFEIQGPDDPQPQLRLYSEQADHFLSELEWGSLDENNVPVLQVTHDVDEGPVFEYRGERALTEQDREALFRLREGAAVDMARREVEKHVQTERLKNKQFKVRGTGVGPLQAGLTGMATGYSIQRITDMVSKYYNDGITPLSYKDEDWEEQNRRATFSGAVAGVSAIVSNYALPYIASSYGLFEKALPSELRSQGIADVYGAVGTGVVTSLTARTLSSAYGYWDGKLSGTDFVLDVTDAAGRALPTALGSVAGHSLFPHSVNIPVLSYLTGVGGYLGSAAGAVVGNVVYDTAKYYVQKGVHKTTKWLYGEGGEGGSDQVRASSAQTVPS